MGTFGRLWNGPRSVPVVGQTVVWRQPKNEEQVRIGDKMGALQNVFSPNLSWRTMISSFFSAFDQFRTMTPIDVVDILVVRISFTVL